MARYYRLPANLADERHLADWVTGAAKHGCLFRLREDALDRVGRMPVSRCCLTCPSQHRTYSLAPKHYELVWDDE